MLGGGRIIAAACCAGVVAVPTSIARATSTGAALSVSAPAAVKTAVTLAATPARPIVGQRVRLAVAAPPGASGFAWNFGGGAFARQTGARAQTETDFAAAGSHSVTVRFSVAGQVRQVVLTLTVAPRPARARHTTRTPHTPHTPRTPDTRHARRAVTTGLAGRVTAHAAGDPAVTVADFHFSPASTTIHVGDTITWTNDGPSSHTATAHGGTFDTGVLKKGQSASHTFTTPGTFTYFCQIHPFMHGTIVVLAATTTSAASTETSAATTPTTTTPTAATAASDGPALPNTGFNVMAGLGVGLLLVGLGAAVRRGARSQMRWGRPPR
jgi:plastocyanin